MFFIAPLFVRVSEVFKHEQKLCVKLWRYQIKKVPFIWFWRLDKLSFGEWCYLMALCVKIWEFVNLENSISKIWIFGDVDSYFIDSCGKGWYLSSYFSIEITCLWKQAYFNEILMARKLGLNTSRTNALHKCPLLGW